MMCCSGDATLPVVLGVIATEIYRMREFYQAWSGVNEFLTQAVSEISRKNETISLMRSGSETAEVRVRALAEAVRPYLPAWELNANMGRNVWRVAYRVCIFGRMQP